MKTASLLVCLSGCLFLSCRPKQSNEEIKFIASAEFKKQNLPFSEGVMVGNTFYLSGQVGTLPGGDILVEGGIKDEAKQMLENIKDLLEQNGSSLEDVVKCTVMLADISEWADFNSVYVQYFPNDKPARSAFGTSGLALGARVEMECVAVIKN